MEFAQIALSCVLAEALWESLKMVWKDKKVNINQVGTLVIGIAFAILAGVNLPATVGLTMPVIVGQIVTGIIISRGSNYLYDLMAKLGKGGNTDGN